MKANLQKYSLKRNNRKFAFNINYVVQKYKVKVSLKLYRVDF